MSGCTVTRSTTLSSSTSTYSPSNQTGVASSNSSLISLQYEEQSKLTLRRNFQRILLLHSDTHHNKSSPSTRGSPSSVSTSTVRDQISVTSQGARTHAQVIPFPTLYNVDTSLYYRTTYKCSICRPHSPSVTKHKSSAQVPGLTHKFPPTPTLYNVDNSLYYRGHIQVFHLQTTFSQCYKTQVTSTQVPVLTLIQDQTHPDFVIQATLAILNFQPRPDRSPRTTMSPSPALRTQSISQSTMNQSPAIQPH